MCTVLISLTLFASMHVVMCTLVPWLLFPALTAISANGVQVPYGYAPYVLVKVESCDFKKNWCLGLSLSGFALSVNVLNTTSEFCTHYCPQKTHAHWMPFYDQYLDTGSFLLSAFVKTLDDSSCLPVPGGFRCSELVVTDTPMNKLSILLHATTRNKEYFFGEKPEPICQSDPQCVAFVLLKNTLYALPGNIRWPNTEDVLTLRNSLYACVLAYVGLGETESIATCYKQLGDRCFYSEGNKFCIGNGRGGSLGITDANTRASAPIAICEISEYLKIKELAHRPTAKEMRDFLIPSSCDATILSLDHMRYNTPEHTFSIALDLEAFHTISEEMHVLLRVRFDMSLGVKHIKFDDISTFVKKFANTISGLIVATHSSGVIVDASEWTRLCVRKEGREQNWLTCFGFTSLLSKIAHALIANGSSKLFLRLPRSQEVLDTVNFSQLDVFNAFLTPVGRVNMSQPGHCQNMWVSENIGQVSDGNGLMPYLMALLERGVKANKIIVTISLTGGIRLVPKDKQSHLKDTGLVGGLSIAEMETNTALQCQEDLNSKCCSWSGVTLWARQVVVNVTVLSTSLETLKSLPELIAVSFGINQFAIAPVDSDFIRGVRSNTPAILALTSAVHRLRNWKRQQVASGLGTTLPVQRTRRSSDTTAIVRNLKPDKISLGILDSNYMDPASGTKNCLDPQYNVGLGNSLVCPGLLAAHGALGVFKLPYKELYATSYDKIYLADLYKLRSCSPGEPSRKAFVSTRAPQVALNINTLVPTTDPKHYAVGILDSERLVEYAPAVDKLCVAHNTGETTQKMNLVQVDDGYTMDRPTVELEHGLVVKPVEALYFVSNFTPGVDYINLNISCINYDVSALKPCLIAICGGDIGCRMDYGRLCNSAHEIVNDARRAGEMMREGLAELAVQETKARMYELSDFAPLPSLNRESHRRQKRFLGLVTGIAALVIATDLSHRVDAIEEQMDTTKNQLLTLSGQVVEVSKKMKANIAMVNSRIDRQEERIRRNNELVNDNFALMQEVMMKNADTAMRDTNTKFSVMASYQMWYAQMQSVTHQMMQAAMHTKFMARGIENCLRQIASKRSGSCPSGLAVLQEHPGLSEFPTIGAALYKNRKLFVVHSIPGTVKKTAVRGMIPMPKLSDDGVPCWPDYDVWLVEGKYYEPSECHGKYCHQPSPHERYQRCVDNSAECKTVCASCHRGICFRDNKITWMEGSVKVDIESPPLKPFTGHHISDGPVSFADLLKDALPNVSTLSVLQSLNTSAKLLDVQENLDNITRSVHEFEKKYDDITSRRTKLALSKLGLLSSPGLWTSVMILMGWCSVLSAVLCCMVLNRNSSSRDSAHLLPLSFNKRPKKLL